MTIKEKLQKFKEIIENPTITNDELAIVIGVELYDYIQEVPELKKEFSRRFHYFDKFSSGGEVDADTRINSLKLHIKQFLHFFLDCAGVRLIKGYEGIFHSSGGKLYNNRSIKKSSLVVIDDLIETTTGNESSGDPFLFYLSRTMGLYRYKNDDKEIYKLIPASQRYQIIDSLEKSYKATKDLSKEIGTTPTKLRAQIAGLKKEIPKKFRGLRGDSFIESEQKVGYRLGDKIILKKEQ